MRVHVGTDHAGFETKGLLVEWLEKTGHDVIDHGAYELDPDDDYPTPCISAAEAAAADGDALGIVLGGSGNGEQMAANRVDGVRAALVWNRETAMLARAHNNANVIAVGARQHTPEEIISFVATFLAEPFSADPRHQRRIDAISAYEQSRSQSQR
ncbi:ribose-5-phosphate isomerase [Georgenia sp. TF02-10]|uniref:ribose-5-phosphate isomerase n=1 Tax=Georgenia sp. TF02-10 TaxID=2917725 RepID=UPI001FA7A968|nr:ribose-5-phosphate isomerase [Georgenia sp. TF02-10]UNX55386.1 ribose-5-phosphate isomerase [Georgenia sp. TF02-10]